MPNAVSNERMRAVRAGSPPRALQVQPIQFGQGIQFAALLDRPATAARMLAIGSGPGTTSVP